MSEFTVTNVTLADGALEHLKQTGLIQPTGHAAGRRQEDIFAAAGDGERMQIVQSDTEGYPQVDEGWEAMRFSDKSLLIATYVRGRKEVDYWKAIDNLNGFEVWRTH